MKTVRRKKILFVLGTRPEALKLAPLIDQTRRSSRLIACVCLTAQHREMLDHVLELFKIRADYDLDLMRKGQTLHSLTGRVLSRMRKVLNEVRPDLVVVQGDTTSAFAAALAAFYEKYPVAHVEAGLRSRQKYQPFPEEMNRVMITRLADYHFAPTEKTRRNLLGEGIRPEKIFVTGNTIVDTLQGMKEAMNGCRSPLIKSLPLKKKILLVTAHRRENFGKPLRSICRSLKALARSHKDLEIIYPVHLNPAVQKIVAEEMKGARQERIRLVRPLPYREFLALMSRSYLILTDSGGVQEEAPSIGKPVLVARNVSEREEGIKAGLAKLVGTCEERIFKEASRLLTNRSSYLKMVRRSNPYGDGNASRRIVHALEKIFA